LGRVKYYQKRNLSLISLIVSQNWTDLLTYQPMSRCNVRI
jgi:hypothetical protein